ncbi:hypothetical protein C8T65DRAFT_695090 [Cerioporus squamosus]|nr:hypothetical protein C8T65DRAFT_695090 [Cerioporus squamosus]
MHSLNQCPQIAISSLRLPTYHQYTMSVHYALIYQTARMNHQHCEELKQQVWASENSFRILSLPKRLRSSSCNRQCAQRRLKQTSSPNDLKLYCTNSVTISQSASKITRHLRAKSTAFTSQKERNDALRRMGRLHARMAAQAATQSRLILDAHLCRAQYENLSQDLDTEDGGTIALHDLMNALHIYDGLMLSISTRRQEHLKELHTIKCFLETVSGRSSVMYNDI